VLAGRPERRAAPDPCGIVRLQESVHQR
jgi:hypothetical protein